MLQLKELYEYTQAELRNAFGSTWKLHRRLSGFEIDSLSRQVREGKKHLFAPSNIISSYSCDSMAHSYGVILTRDIPVEDIVMVYSLVDHPQKCEHLKFIQEAEGEVWVLNRNKFGKVCVERDWIRDYTGDLNSPFQMPYIQRPIPPVIDQDDGMALLEAYTHETLPCEYDIFSRWLIQRNKRKLEDKLK